MQRRSPIGRRLFPYLCRISCSKIEWQEEVAWQFLPVYRAVHDSTESKNVEKWRQKNGKSKKQSEVMGE